LWLSVVVIVLDQYTKHYIVQHLVYAENIVVHPMLNITRLHNTGAAFSFLADASGWQHWLFIGMGVVVAIAILVWMRFLHRQPWLARGTRADARWRARQRDRPCALRLRDRLHPRALRAAVLACVQRRRLGTERGAR
jgi:hypothetical protein